CKRSVNYAIRGKAFANVLADSNEVFLLELILNNAKHILSQMKDGAVICCSDILVDTSGLYLDSDDNLGFCAEADLETGTRHGVMFPDERGMLKSYPHKAGKNELLALCEPGQDKVLIDTGMLYFRGELCHKLCSIEKDCKICERLYENKIELNLYPEIVSLLSESIDKQFFISENAQNSEHKEIRRELYESLCGFSLKVCRIHGDFIHFGSLDESRINVLKLSASEKPYLKLNSYIGDVNTIGKDTVFDNVMLEGVCEVGSGCFVSDITLDSCKISDGKAVCGIRLRDGTYCTVMTDIDENPKECIGSLALWDTPRFYKGKSFTDSYNKLCENIGEEKYSLEYIMENADFDYYFSRRQYLKDMNSYRVNPIYLQKRNEVIDHYFKLHPPLASVHCKKEKTEINLPVRVNLSGTWTDAMPYCIDNGGQVINMAVTLDGELPIKVTVERLTEKKIEFCSDGVRTDFSFGTEDCEEDLSDFILHISALKTLGFSENTVFDCGFRLITRVSGIDKGSGLGTSSILLGGCLKALGEFFGIERSNGEILKMVFVAEQIMKTGGGWQDQVGGLLPSIKAGTTKPGIEQGLDVKYIVPAENIKRLFSDSLVLLPTGQRHFGRFIVNDVVNRYLDNNEQSLEGHKKIRELNKEIVESIENGNIASFCRCVNQHRELLKLISPLVTNEAIDAMVNRCFEVADAVSFLGAGGGGYLLVVLKENISVKAFMQFVADNFKTVKSPVKKIDVYN
ncbi:MAG: L-fucokinase, partial [Acutalibacteraceae bacterium]